MISPAKIRDDQHTIRMRTIERTVARSAVEELGEVNGRAYVRHRGREYMLDQSAGDPADYDLGLDDVLFLTEDRLIDDGYGRMVTDPAGAAFRRALEVPAGTYEALVARYEKIDRRVERTTTARPIDRVRHAEAQSIGELLDRWQRRGIALSVTPSGRLLVETPGGRHHDSLPAIASLERLIVAELTSVTLRCELHAACGRTATTIAPLDVAWCGVQE